MPPKKKANGYRFPEKLPKGEILVDVAKKSWVLGDSIGKGGFGEIYCAAEGSAKNPSSWPFVIKIEPHENGPLFMEKNFYLKFAKPDEVKSWQKKEGLKSLGMPSYLGGGSHTYNNLKYRFLVIDRFGQDLHSLLIKNNTFPLHTVYKCALQILDTLKYIHSKGYMHGDIKGANLLLGWKPGTENQVFLVDFGLATKYSQKPFENDPKQAHNGTIEYTSCDMHCGVPTRRADLEILGYNLLHWIAGSLPWEKDIAKKDIVHKKKQELLKDVDAYISKNMSNVPRVMVVYLTYVSKLKHDEEPNYKYCKELFTKALKEIGSSPTEPLEFSQSKSSAPLPNKKAKKVNKDAKDLDANENEEPVPAPKGIPKKVPAKPRGRKAAVQKETVLESDDNEELIPSPRKRGPPKPRVDHLDADSDPEMGLASKVVKTKFRGRKAAGQRGVILASDDEEEEGVARRKAKASDVSEDDEPDLVPSPKKKATRKPRQNKGGSDAKKDTLAESDDDLVPLSPVLPSKRNLDDPPLNGNRLAGSNNKKSKASPRNAAKPKLNWRDAPKCLINKKM